MSKQYQYHSLATKSTVRLIKLEESKIDERIACEIRYIEQSNAEYDALSYVWGDPTPTREMLIYDENDGEWTSFPVHENLWQFLHSAWQRRIFDRWLWTDRICLNQKDETEKSEQIPRMAEIYHTAVQVIAWMGLSASQGENLIRVRDFIQTDWFLFDSKPAARLDDPELAAIKAVLEAEYWERVWIVQEVACAKKAVCFIGNMDMTFDEVDVLESLVKPLGHGPISHWHFILSFLRHVGRIARKSGAPSLDLWYLLKKVTCEHFKSQQPHDRVYGILGLVANLSDGTSPLRHIEIDYGKPSADVFFDAILESHPEWNIDGAASYRTAINLLLERPDNTTTWEPRAIFTFLTRYTESDRTSQRHKQLAKLVLSVSDALYFLASISRSPPGNRQTGQAFSELVMWLGSDIPLRRTAQHNAVILGVALALAIENKRETTKMFEDWKACRHSRVAASSPWRCAAHRLSAHGKTPFQHVDRPRPGEKSKFQLEQFIEGCQAEECKQVAQRTREFRCSMELEGALGSKTQREKACGGSKDRPSAESCNGSFVSCEFPEANFRLQFSCSGWHTATMHVSFLAPHDDYRHYVKS